MPDYLKSSESSELYKKLDFEEEININQDKFKENDNVCNIENRILLFETCNYWIVDNYPENLLNYYIYNLKEVNIYLN